MLRDAALASISRRQESLKTGHLVLILHQSAEWDRHHRSLMANDSKRFSPKQ